MGCSGGKLDVEASMQEARASPLQGLPVLKGALEQRGNPGQEESAKTNVSQVFELLPKAIGDLKVKDRKAIVAAGAVIERCVKLVNDPAVGAGSPTIDPENLKQCIIELSSLLKKVQSQGGETYRTNFMEDDGCSTDATAIAGALTALLKLEDHAAACREEVAKSGLGVAVNCMKIESGLKTDARQAFVTMFVVLLEEPNSAQDLIDKQGLYVLLPYCVEPKTYGVSKEFQLLCTGLLENCIKNGQGISNKIEVEAAIKSARK